MDKCAIKIRTAVDGVESVATFQGECALGENVTVCYCDNQAQVRVAVGEGKATVERTGDYGLSLTLVPMQKTQGALSLGGFRGEVQTQTEQIKYSVQENEAFILLSYTLFAGAEEQRMKIFMTVRKEKGNE